MKRMMMIGMCILIVLVGCTKDIEFDREPHRSVLSHEAESDYLQDKLVVADCEAFALFPKGNSINTRDDKGVIVWICTINNKTCYYIEPNGRLGASIDCD